MYPLGSRLCFSRCRHARREVSHVTPHRPTQPHQRDERQVVLPTLDPANIAAIQPRLVGQSLLRHTEFSPLGADALA